MIMKFRAWDKKHSEMIKVVSINFDENFIRGLTEVESDSDLDIESSYNFEDVELMQSTGLKDKNGVEIFEGNIVRIKSSDGVDYKAVIIFKDGGFCAVDGIEDNYSTRRYQLHKGDFELEVIGNKYEHPHLLEG